MLLQVAIITVIQVSNQYIIIPNYNLIKEDLGLSDFILGSMTGLYIFLSGISTVVWSYISDATGVKRKWLMALSIFIAGMFTYAVFMTTNIILFFTCRVITGIFLGAIFPLSYSIIADFFESEKRTSAYMLWYIITGIGMAVGFGTSVLLGAYRGWRYPIYLNAILLLTIGTLLSLILIEPSRGIADVLKVYGVESEYTYRFHISDARIILSNKSNIYVAFEEFVSTLPQGVLLAWMTQYVVREMVATETVALIFLGLGMLGGLFGIIIAYLADFLYRRNPRYRPFIASISSYAQTIFFTIFLILPIRLNITDPNPINSAKQFLSLLKTQILLPVAILMFFFGMMFNSSIEPIKNSVISDINLPEQRAIVVSSISTVELFFRSAGISIAGLISDLTGSIRITLIAFVLLYIIAGNLWLNVVRHYNEDVEKTKKRLIERLNKNKPNDGTSSEVENQA